MCAISQYPQYMSNGVRKLLNGLLEKDPSKRIGSCPVGAEAEQLKSHAFFKVCVCVWGGALSCWLGSASQRALH